MSGPNKENPITALYYFIKGQLEFGDGSRIEQAGELTGDEVTIEVGKVRKKGGLQLMDEAIDLAKQRRQQKS